MRSAEDENTRKHLEHELEAKRERDAMAKIREEQARKEAKAGAQAKIDALKFNKEVTGSSGAEGSRPSGKFGVGHEIKGTSMDGF